MIQNPQSSPRRARSTGGGGEECRESERKQRQRLHPNPGGADSATTQTPAPLTLPPGLPLCFGKCQEVVTETPIKRLGKVLSHHPPKHKALFGSWCSCSRITVTHEGMGLGLQPPMATSGMPSPWEPWYLASVAVMASAEC